MIYLIVNYEENICKIGYSEKPEARLVYLQTGSPYPLSIASILEGNMQDEKKLHKQFDKYRMQGEWFVYGEEIKKHFNAIDKRGMLINPNMVNVIVRLPHSELKFLLAVLPHIKEYNNDFHIEETLMKSVIQCSGLKESTIRNAVSRLTRKNILKRKKANWYILNPEIFFKGKELARSKMFELTYQWAIK
jgi:hypothetical protein